MDVVGGARAGAAQGARGRFARGGTDVEESTARGWANRVRRLCVRCASATDVADDPWRRVHAPAA